MDLFKRLLCKNSHGVNCAIASDAVISDNMCFGQFGNDGNGYQSHIDLVIQEHRGDMGGIVHHQLNILVYRVLG